MFSNWRNLFIVLRNFLFILSELQELGTIVVLRVLRDFVVFFPLLPLSSSLGSLPAQDEPLIDTHVIGPDIL